MPDPNTATPVNDQGKDPAGTSDQADVKDLPGSAATDNGATDDKTVSDESAKDNTSQEDTDGSDTEETSDDTPLDTNVWGDTGDEVANSTLQLLQNSGVTPLEAKAFLFDAVEAGDPSKVDRDALVEKVGKAKAALVMAGVENFTARNNVRVAEVKAVAAEAAGGDDNWAKAAAWAKTALDAGDLDELRGMLDKGGRQAKFAATEIVTRYNADPKNTALNAGKGAVRGDGKSAGGSEKGITRSEYGKQLVLLTRKNASDAEISKLRAKRRLGVQQGI